MLPMRINLHPRLRSVLLKCLRRERRNEGQVIRRRNDPAYRERQYAERRSDVPYAKHVDNQYPPEWFDGTQHGYKFSPSIDRFVTSSTGTLPEESSDKIYQDLELYVKHFMNHNDLMRKCRLIRIKQAHLRLAVRSYLRITS